MFISIFYKNIFLINKVIRKNLLNFYYSYIKKFNYIL